MRSGTRLMIIERHIGSPNEPSKANDVDIFILVMAGGLERTEAQYRDLLKASGFGIRQVRRTPTGLGALEAEEV